MISVRSQLLFKPTRIKKKTLHSQKKKTDWQIHSFSLWTSRRTSKEQVRGQPRFQGPLLALGTPEASHMHMSGSKFGHKGDVTVIWVSPCFGYPRTQIPSVLGIPSRDTQNTGSVKYSRLGQLETPRIRLKNHLYSCEALSQQMKALLIFI